MIERERHGWIEVAAVGAVSAAASGMLWAQLGTRMGGDSVRYLEGAARLLAGQPLVEKQGSYLGYVAFVAAFEHFGAGVTGVVLVQILVAAAAATTLYTICRSEFGRPAGLLAAGFFALNPDIVRWNSYVLTDSLYTSFLIIAVAAITVAARRRSMGAYAGASASILVCALLRPNGWLLVCIGPLCWIAWLCWPKRRRLLAATALVAAAGAAVVGVGSLRGAIENEAPAAALRGGVIIWGYDEWRVAMPVDPRGGSGDWVGSLGYVARHPVASGGLAIARIGAELAHVRPFYSRAHNAGIVIVLVVLYPLAVIGFVRKRGTRLIQICAAVVGGHLMLVGLTFADWDGRFLVYVLPQISILGSAGACAAWARVRA